MSSRDLVKARSRGRCEAEVEIRGRWSRCGHQATEIHHMLPRSRGGRHLDSEGETYHLIHLCREMHAMAHAREDADGLMIDGSVSWDKIKDRPVYQGTDPVLLAKYGEQ